MKDIGRQIEFLQRKIDSMDNDLFKQIALGMLKNFGEKVAGTEFEDSTYKSYITDYQNVLKAQMRELRNSQKKVSKQLDLEDEIRKVQKITTLPEESFCGHKDCPYAAK